MPEYQKATVSQILLGESKLNQVPTVTIKLKLDKPQKWSEGETDQVFSRMYNAEYWHWSLRRAYLLEALGMKPVEFNPETERWRVPVITKDQLEQIVGTELLVALDEEDTPIGRRLLTIGFKPITGGY